MNLWVSRVRQLSVMAVALFFYSCTDDTALNGFKPTDPKFTAQFIEIPVESSVLLFNPLRSSNYYFSGETNLLLVGKYEDDIFGDASASTCTQYFTSNGAKLASTADYDSVSLQLRFNFYTYGDSKSASPQNISIYALDQELSIASKAAYYNNTPIVATRFLGAKSFSVDPTEFQTYMDAGKDTTITVHMRLDSTFGREIFNSAIAYRDATNKADSAFVLPAEFVKLFKGIAIVPNDCDKIMGFNPSSSASNIAIHYHTDKDTLELNLTFVSMVSYNNIAVTNRSAELSGLTVPYQDFTPLNDKRYVQSGTSIFTKLDLGKFLEFTDTIPNIMINSAELVVGNVEDGGAFDPPQSMALRILENNNRQYAFSTETTQSNNDNSLYNGFIRADYYYSAQVLPHINPDSVFTVMNDAYGYNNFTYSKSEKKYSGYLTRFLQQVAVKTENKTRLQYFVLYPYSPSAAKTINRVVFPKDNIKLRIYYTLPTLKN